MPSHSTKKVCPASKGTARLGKFNGQRATRVPELLLFYFADLAPAELFKVALVCRSWSSCANDVLWSRCEVPLSVILSKLSWLSFLPEVGIYVSVRTHSDLSPLFHNRSADL